MLFRIADTFLDGLSKLQREEQKAAKVTVFDLQANPANPGHSFHKLDRAKDKCFWSIRVNRDIRIIVHRTESALLLCYVGHHDKAYDWAERRRLETHPKTGAAQLVELRERIEEIALPAAVSSKARILAAPALANYSAVDLLSFGVPEEWVAPALAADEDELLAIAARLPQEASEAVLKLAVGETPAPPPVATPGSDPFAHPDAARRFRVLDHIEELERALDYPWEKWTVFLHPDQRRFVERQYNGPARISGSAGTGKTIVALHRAVHLARTNPKSRVLLTTFSRPLARALAVRLERLTAGEPQVAARITVEALNDAATRLYREQFGRDPRVISNEETRGFVAEAAKALGVSGFADRFLFDEWSTIVDARQLKSLEDYAGAPRLGRKTRISAKQRAELWRVFETVNRALTDQAKLTWAAVFHALAEVMPSRGGPAFELAIVDEAQDLTLAQLRFLAALGRGRPDALFFAGDLGQRIFQQPFSWKAIGVDIRGRSQTLRTNYRTSHQIRREVDRLLPDAISDLDGNTESRIATVSVFNGPPPEIRVVESQSAEREVVGAWLNQIIASGASQDEIAVIVREERQQDRARDAIKAAGLGARGDGDRAKEGVALLTMHAAKGLEFRAVAVIACDDDVLPLQSRIEGAADESDLEEVYNTERHLLYVACTRARDALLVTGVEPGSEFLADLAQSRG